MRALVTGCNGYIGKVLTRYVKDNYKDSFLLGVDNEPDHKPNTATDLQLFEDLSSERIAEYMLGYQINTVFHLAAEASVPDSLTRPFHYYNNNVGQTALLLSNLEKANWSGNFVFSSSAGVYSKSRLPVREYNTTKSPHPYGDSKILCEEIMRNSIQFQDNIKFTVFRFFNVAGAYNNVGDHLDSGHVLQKICRAAATGEPFIINGSNLQTSDGTCVRDYVHVLDIVRAHLHVVDNMQWNFAEFNLGNSQGVTVRELANRFVEVTGKELDVMYGPPREGDPEFLVADGSKFYALTGFKYEHSDIDNIIVSAWNYYKSRHELERLYAF